ncbi:MAG: hypothetical protein LBM19_00220 [Holosporales bacterium]|nr:hypothetical protein [Holosporales bacterium]
MATTKISDEDRELILKLTGADRRYLLQICEKWSFKDIQSYLRFVVSIMLQGEPVGLGIRKPKEEALSWDCWEYKQPAKHLLLEKD